MKAFNFPNYSGWFTLQTEANSPDFNCHRPWLGELKAECILLLGSSFIHTMCVCPKCKLYLWGGGGGETWGPRSRNWETTVQVRNCGIAWVDGPTNKCLSLHFLWVA